MSRRRPNSHPEQERLKKFIDMYPNIPRDDAFVEECARGLADIFGLPQELMTVRTLQNLAKNVRSCSIRECAELHRDPRKKWFLVAQLWTNRGVIKANIKKIRERLLQDHVFCNLLGAELLATWSLSSESEDVVGIKGDLNVTGSEVQGADGSEPQLEAPVCDLDPVQDSVNGDQILVPDHGSEFYVHLGSDWCATNLDDDVFNPDGENYDANPFTF